MIEDLAGLRCTSVRRFQHRFEGEPGGETGPIEFAWDDGSLLTLDANADWTLHLSSHHWLDPYAKASESERQRLAREVGLWHEVQAESGLQQVVGQAVAAAEPELDEMGELTGLSILFETQVVRARVVEGELTVEVLDR